MPDIALSWETASYIVTVFGFPLAIAVFVLEQRKERENEEEESHQILSDAYAEFLRIVLDNPDLRLRSRALLESLTPEQSERRLLIFDMLVALFERAYLLAHTREEGTKRARRWRNWEDYMMDWIQFPEFAEALPDLLRGEDPEFADFARSLLARPRSESPAIQKPAPTPENSPPPSP